jgi:hypothetical protein
MIKKPNLSSNVLSLYCIFDIQNLVLCLTRELIKFIDYKIITLLKHNIPVSQKSYRVAHQADYQVNSI